LTELGYLSSHGGVFRPVYVDQIESWYGRIPHGPVYHAKLGAWTQKCQSLLQVAVFCVFVTKGQIWWGKLYQRFTHLRHWSYL